MSTGADGHRPRAALRNARFHRFSRDLSIPSKGGARVETESRQPVVSRETRCRTDRRHPNGRGRQKRKPTRAFSGSRKAGPAAARHWPKKIEMNDPLIVLSLAELLLFFGWAGTLFGRKSSGRKRKRTGIALLAVWIVVFSVLVTWGIIRKVSQ